MRALSPFELLRIWERGAARHPAGRALAVLAVASPEVDRRALAAIPIGVRDRILAALRLATFGPTATGWDECARCGAQVEFGVPIEAIASAASPEADEVEVPLSAGTARVRLPNSDDLLAVADLDEEEARQALALRCVLGIDRDGDEREGVRLDQEETERIGAALAALNPHSVTTMHVACVACGHDWERDVEIGAFVWDEVAAAARRLLYEVGTLASAWGWSERDILAMSPRRRQSYMAMVTG